jgi:hypothetical protein
LWRQVVVAITVGNARDLWTNKGLAVRAIALGWAATWVFAKVWWAVVTLLLPASAVEPQPATWLNAVVFAGFLHTALVRVSAGWLVGRLHRPFSVAMVLAFLASLVTLDLPWLIRRAVDASTNPFLVTLFLHQLVTWVVSVIGVVVGGAWSRPTDGLTSVDLGSAV